MKCSAWVSLWIKVQITKDWDWETETERPDLEKVASGASSACGHSFRNHAILRTFWAKYLVLFTEDGKRSVDDWKLKLDKRDLR